MLIVFILILKIIMATKKIKKKIKPRVKKNKRRVRQANQLYKETKKIEIVHRFEMAPFKEHRKLNTVPIIPQYYFHKKVSKTDDDDDRRPRDEAHAPKRPRQRGPEDDHPPPIKRPREPAEIIPVYNFF
jgi:hypothetical protein